MTLDTLGKRIPTPTTNNHLCGRNAKQRRQIMASVKQIAFIEGLQNFAPGRVIAAKDTWGDDLADMPVKEAKILIEDLVNIRDNKFSNEVDFKECNQNCGYSNGFFKGTNLVKKQIIHLLETTYANTDSRAELIKKIKEI
jgi:hypothetical protein